MSNILTFEKIRFSYNGNYENSFLLNDISFNIEDGEFVSVIGKNGSGKSTLIKLISRIISSYDGTIFFKGTDIKNIDTKEYSRNISYVPQSFNLINSNLNVRELLLMGRYPLKRFLDFRNSKEDIDTVNAAMEETGILEFSERNLWELSGGEKQKVMLTLGLVQLNIKEQLSEKVLIIDEPVTYLDVNFQIEIFRILKRLNGKGLTIIIVIHDLNSALNYTDKTILMNEGKLVMFSDTDKVITENMLREHFFIESKIINYENRFLINFSL